MPRLDPIAREVACRRLSVAFDLACARLDELLQSDGSRVEIAGATREVAEILIADGRVPAATPHVFEARRRYRPFRQSSRLSGEVDLLLADHAFRTGQSGSGEVILADVLTRTATDPDARLVWGRAVRFQAHLAVIRGDFEIADERLVRALEATEWHRHDGGDAREAERLLNRSQYLFTKGEIAIARGELAAARAWTEEAVRFTDSSFGDEPMYRAFAHQRAAHAFEVIDAVAVAGGPRGDENSNPGW